MSKEIFKDQAASVAWRKREWENNQSTSWEKKEREIKADRDWKERRRSQLNGTTYKQTTMTDRWDSTQTAKR